MDDDCGLMFCLFTWWFRIQELTNFLTGNKARLAASRGAERVFSFLFVCFFETSTFQKERDLFWGPSSFSDVVVSYPAVWLSS